MTYNPGMASDDVRLSEVLFEFHRIGNYVRVSAIDTRTNTEVQIVGATGYNQEMLKRVALRKLKYVLAKKRGAGQDGGRGPDGSILA